MRGPLHGCGRATLPEYAESVMQIAFGCPLDGGILRHARMRRTYIPEAEGFVAGKRIAVRDRCPRGDLGAAGIAFGSHPIWEASSPSPQRCSTRVSRAVTQSFDHTAGVAYPRVDRFDSVSVILPVLNETTSLTRTVDIVLRDAKPVVKELLIVVSAKTTPDAMAAVGRLREEQGSLVVVIVQRLPFLGGALRDAFDAARGSHAIMMASDMETNPCDVKRLIDEAKKMPWGIVTASRWHSGGSFRGYPKVKLVCNWVFQRCFSLLYGTTLTDMTYGYRILPTRLAQAIRWEELRHPFNLESIVKPLRLGVPCVEVPSAWQPRMEGTTSNPFLRNFAYFRTGLKTRFASPRSLLKPSLLKPN
jgi:hypothetical protein